MAFDWARAIERNRDDLIGIVTTLFVLAGIRTGAVATTLPRALYLRILGLLRPAEYAARRLILMAACKLVRPASPLWGGRRLASEARQSRVGVKTADRGDLLPPPGSAAPRAARPVCFSDLPTRGRSGAVPVPPAADVAPAFALFDPFKRYGHPWLEPDDIAALGILAGPEPRLDEPVGAAGLFRRIRALERVLQDLDRAALRLARWRARRDRETTRPSRWSVMRPGQPPGWKRRPKTPAEAVLKECHTLALDAWNTTRAPPASASEA